MRVESRRIKKWNETHKIISGVDHKLCRKCGEFKPSTTDFFYKHKSKVDGLNPNCIICVIKMSKERIYQNYDEFKEYLRKYDKQLWVREQKTKRGQKYRTSDTYSDWIVTNRNKLKEFSSDRYYNKTHDITDIEWMICKEYFDNSCAYCGLKDDDHFKKMNGRWTKMDLFRDHVDHFGSNMIDNCIPSCHICNSSKHNSNIEEWYTEKRTFYSEDKYKKIIKWVIGDWKMVDGEN